MTEPDASSANEAKAVARDLKTLRERLVANASKLISSTTVGALLGLASFALSARALEPMAFGKLMLIVTFANAVSRFTGFESSQAVIKFASDARERGDDAEIGRFFRFGFLLDLAGCLVAGIVLFAGANLFADILNWQPEVTSGVILFAFVVLFSVSSAPNAVLRLYDRFDVIAWHRIVSSSIKLVLVVVAVAISPDLVGFLCAWAVAQVIHHISLCLLAHRVSVKHGHRYGPSNEYVFFSMPGEVWRFVWMTNLETMLRAFRDLDLQIVALVLDEAAAGVVRIARQIGSIVMIAVNALLESAYPELARLSSERSWKLFRAFTRQGVYLGVGSVVVALIGFAVIGKPLIPLVFGQGYEEVYLITLLLIFAIGLLATIQITWIALLSLAEQGKLLRNGLLATFGYAALLWFGLHSYGLYGAPIAFIGLYAIWGILSVLSYRSALARAETVA